MAKSYVPREESELLAFLQDLDCEGEDGQKQKRSAWKRDLRLYHTGIPDTNTDQYPIFSANLLAPLIRRKAALLTEMKPQLDVRPRREGLSNTAHILRQTINAGWDEQSTAMVLEDMAMFAQVFGSAGAQITWDSAANYGLGDIGVFALDPRNVLFDPSIRYARDLDYAEYVRVRHVVSLSRAKRAYPHVADDIKPSGKVLATDDDKQLIAPGSRIKGGIEAAQRGITPGQRTAIPRVELKEYWIADPEENEDGSPVYPNGRVIVRADDVICSSSKLDDHDIPEDANPYYDGTWPFVWLDNQMDFDSAWGRSEIEAIRRVQETFNRLGNLYVKVMVIGSLPFIIADQNALEQDAINTLRDMGYYVLTKMAGRTVERIPPPVPGGALQGFMQYIGQGLMENIAGLNDGGGTPAKGRTEMRSAVMLEGLQQASQVLIRAQARRLESFLERLGQKWISRVFQFYTNDRLMTFIGSGDQIKSYTFERAKLMLELVTLARERLKQERQREADQEAAAANAGSGIMSLSRTVVPLPVLEQDELLAAVKGAWRDFRFKIRPFSTLSANRIARSQMMMQLSQAAMLPSWMALEDLGFDNPKDLFQEAIEEAMRRQAAGIQPGGGQQKAKDQKKK